MSAPVAGNISRVLVDDGGSVRAGQALLVITSERYTGAGLSVEGAINRDLQEQVKTIGQTISNARLQALHSGNDLTQQLRYVEVQAARTEEQISIAAANLLEQQALLSKMSQLLEKSYISGFEVQRQRTAVAEARSAVSRLKATQVSGAREAQELRGRLNQISSDLEKNLNSANIQLAQTSVDQSRNNAARISVIRAPADGVITTLVVRPGQTIAIGQFLMRIVPSGTEMEVEALVPSSAIGFVAPRQAVALRFRAFPFQKFGAMAGTVRSVATTTMSPDEIKALYGIQSQAAEPMYRVRIKDIPQHVKFDSGKRPIMPGMLVDADIMVERRQIYEWVLGPIYSLHSKSKGQTE